MKWLTLLNLFFSWGNGNWHMYRVEQFTNFTGIPATSENFFQKGSAGVLPQVAFYRREKDQFVDRDFYQLLGWKNHSSICYLYYLDHPSSCNLMTLMPFPNCQQAEHHLQKLLGVYGCQSRLFPTIKGHYLIYSMLLLGFILVGSLCIHDRIGSRIFSFYTQSRMMPYLPNHFTSNQLTVWNWGRDLLLSIPKELALELKLDRGIQVNSTIQKGKESVKVSSKEVAPLSTKLLYCDLASWGNCIYKNSTKSMVSNFLRSMPAPYNIGLVTPKAEHFFDKKFIKKLQLEKFIKRNNYWISHIFITLIPQEELKKKMPKKEKGGVITNCLPKQKKFSISIFIKKVKQISLTTFLFGGSISFLAWFFSHLLIEKEHLMVANRKHLSCIEPSSQIFNFEELYIYVYQQKNLYIALGRTFTGLKNSTLHLYPDPMPIMADSSCELLPKSMTIYHLSDLSFYLILGSLLSGMFYLGWRIWCKDYGNAQKEKKRLLKDCSTQERAKINLSFIPKQIYKYVMISLSRSEYLKLLAILPALHNFCKEKNPYKGQKWVIEVYDSPMNKKQPFSPNNQSNRVDSKITVQQEIISSIKWLQKIIHNARPGQVIAIQCHEPLVSTYCPIKRGVEFIPLRSLHKMNLQTQDTLVQQ